MAFSSVKPDGTEVLVILAISDQEAVTREGAIEISLMEKVNAGLDPSRPAFVHLTEFNLDHLGKSWFFNANAKSSAVLAKRSLNTSWRELPSR